MFKKILSSYFARSIYPTYSNDWYKRKGYFGNSHFERFNDFVKKQKEPISIFYKEFKSLTLKRDFLISGNNKIDTIIISPNKNVSFNKPGNGLYIICFQGRGEYYESKFRDMALMARNTGAIIIGFNPKGFNSSTGKTNVLQDIVNDGIVLVKTLLNQKIHHNKIVLYGNSLGAGVQEMVCQYFRQTKSIDFRQINSNSFRSLSAVVSSNIGMPFLEKFFYHLMKYSGWEITYDKNFCKTGVYRCYLSRQNDKTIKPRASFYANINSAQDVADTNIEYKETLIWLNKNSMLVQLNNTIKDIHNLSLHSLHLRITDENGKNLTPWYFINKYLLASNYILDKELF